MGSTVAPTDEELALHEGLWRAQSTGDLVADMMPARMAAAVRDNDRDAGVTRRWWALTTDGTPTARPAVPKGNDPR